MAVVSASIIGAPRSSQEAGSGRDPLLRPPISGSFAWSSATNNSASGGYGSYVGYEETERAGIVTTRISNAALVVSRDGAYPVVITPGTRVVGQRAAFDAINRFDVVRVRGRSTASGALIADVIEVTMIPNSYQLQQMGLTTASVSVNGTAGWTGVVGPGSLAGQLLGGGGEAAANRGGSINAGASVSGGASVNAGGASVSAGGGASVNAGGASVSAGGGGGASVSAGGASVSAGGGSGASVSAGGASVSAGGGSGASVNAGGASVSGGGAASTNAGKASAGGGASVGTGGAAVSGGAAVKSGGVSVGGGVSAGGGSGGSPAAGGVDVGGIAKR